jgi:hypothetical protein
VQTVFDDKNQFYLQTMQVVASVHVVQFVSEHIVHVPAFEKYPSTQTVHVLISGVQIRQLVLSEHSEQLPLMATQPY